MPRRARFAISATHYHVMNRSSRKATIFATRKDYLSFIHVLVEGLAEHPVELLSYCVMPNHWHLVVRVDMNADYVNIVRSDCELVAMERAEMRRARAPLLNLASPVPN